MPLISISNFKALSFNGDYWLNYTYQGAMSAVPNYASNPLCMDSQGNYITVCKAERHDDLQSKAGISVLKYSTAGDIIKSVHLEDSVTTSVFDVVADASDSIYMLCGALPYSYHLIKFDSELNLLWIKQLSASTSPLYSSLKVSPDGSIFALGSCVAKISSDGDYVWSRTGFSTGTSGCSAVDTAGNIYVASNSASGFNFAKISGAGTLLASKSFTPNPAVNSTSPNSMLIDASGNVILIAQRVEGTQPSLTYHQHVLKLNSALTSILWQKKLTYSTNISGGSCLDSAGDIYLGVDSANSLCLVKLANATGNIAWQKRVAVDRVSERVMPWGLLVDANDDLIVTMMQYGSLGGTTGYETFYGLMKIPSDGSLIGKLGPVTFSTPAFVSTIPTCPIGTLAVTLTAQAYTSTVISPTVLYTVPEYLKTNVYWDAINIGEAVTFNVKEDGTKVYMAGAYVPGSVAQACLTVLDDTLSVIRTIGCSTLPSGYTNSYFTDCGVDGSGNIYCSGYQVSATLNDALSIAKFSSAGALLWQSAKVSDDATLASGMQLSVLPDGVCLASYTLSASVGLAMLRYTSAGAGNLSIKYGSTAFSMSSGHAIQDSAGNIYAAITVVLTSGARPIGVICKMTSAGAIVWQKSYSHPTGSCTGFDVVFSGGALYATGGIYTTNANQIAPLLMRISETDGSVIWQQTGTEQPLNPDRTGNIVDDGAGTLSVYGNHYISKFTTAGEYLESYHSDAPLGAVLNGVVYYEIGSDAYAYPTTLVDPFPYQKAYSIGSSLVVATATLTVTAYTAGAVATTSSWTQVSLGAIKYKAVRGLDINKTLFT